MRAQLFFASVDYSPLLPPLEAGRRGG